MRFLFVLLSFALVLLAGNTVRADDGRLMVTEENDKFASSDDRHYTQGLQISWLPGMVDPASGWNSPFVWLNDIVPVFGGGDFKRQYDWTVVGQSIFTPRAIHSPDPPSTDRPYGAWLYTGVGLLQEDRYESHDTLENMEMQAGVVGPLALGGVVQNDFHQFIGVRPATGWRNQIHNEPGLDLTYERKWRFEAPLGGGMAVDAIPEMGGTLGNVFTYAEAGGMVRFGRNLAADYGPRHVRPSLSGTGWFDPSRLDGSLGWYLFAGTQGRAMGRNIFLDGNSYTASASVDKKLLVADFLAGASVFWSRAMRVDFTFTERTKEYYGQPGTPDRFGSIGLVIGF